MATRFTNPDPVPEGVGWRYTGTLKDEAGAVIPAGAFAALTLKIYLLDAALTYIVGSPTPVDILNAGRGSLDSASGLLTITFLPSDSDMVNTDARDESHLALVEGTYSVTRRFAHEIRWTVVNLARRP